MSKLILPSDGASMDPWTARYRSSIWGVNFDVPGISQIRGNLYVGGYTPGMVLPREFIHVVSLHSPGFMIADDHDVTVSRFVIDDDDRVPVSRAAVVALAREALEKATQGPVLFHCQMGVNRSAMVAAIALVLSGYPPRRAIETVRQARPGTLSNPLFQDFILNFKADPS